MTPKRLVNLLRVSPRLLEYGFMDLSTMSSIGVPVVSRQPLEVDDLIARTLANVGPSEQAPQR